MPEKPLGKPLLRKIGFFNRKNKWIRILKVVLGTPLIWRNCWIYPYLKSKLSTVESAVHSCSLGANYVEIFNLVWNFNLVFRVEIWCRLNRELLFKMTLQLHLKILNWYTELKFQLSLVNPRWNLNPLWKFQIFLIVNIFTDPGWKFNTTHARITCLLFFKKRWRLHKHVSKGPITNLSIS